MAARAEAEPAPARGVRGEVGHVDAVAQELEGRVRGEPLHPDEEPTIAAGVDHRTVAARPAHHAGRVERFFLAVRRGRGGPE